jgi:hypothetical protein
MASLERAIPFEDLPPRQFERFSANLLRALYPDAQVCLYGHEGHKQGGIDVKVKTPEGRTWGVQAKRRARFGPALMRKAAQDLALATDHNLLFLSSQASPALRDTMDLLPKWELWDAEDLSDKVWTLPRAERIHLVDRFFPGRRVEILGDPEPSPWLNPTQAFAGLEESVWNFSHAWELVGRTKELDQLHAWIRDPQQPLCFLHGPGGAGKSRLLKAFTEQFERAMPSWRIYYLSEEPLQARHFEDVGKGSQLWVCDDAHRRSDLELLLRQVAARKGEVKLLVALRSYGLDQILQRVTVFYSSTAPKLLLAPLRAKDSERLARAALERFGGDPGLAGDLGRATRDCPLATVLGAQVLAKQGPGLHPAFLLTEPAFQEVVLAKVVDSHVQAVSQGCQGQAVEGTLQLLALVQPFRPMEESLWELVDKITGLSNHQVPDLLIRLERLGFLLERAGQCRIVPDLLADFLVKQSCITQEGASTGYAERVMEAGGPAMLESLLFNLGQLDWRLRRGKPIGPHRVLRKLWGRLAWSDSYPNADVEAAARVSYYQPELALELVDRLMQEGHGGKPVVAILEPIAYHERHLTAVCERLWQLCRAGFQLGKAAWEPAMVALGALATPRQDIPIGLMDQVVDFGLSLVDRGEPLTGPCSPLDFLCHALSVEGSSETATAWAITFRPFWVIPEVVAPIRRKVIGCLLHLLNHPDPSVACAAARRFQSALRRPIGQFNLAIPAEVHDAWRTEFRGALEDLNRIVDGVSLAPIVLFSIAESVVWIEQHESPEVAEPARRIVERFRADPQGRLVSALINPYQPLLYPLGSTPPHECLKPIAQDLLQLRMTPSALFAKVTSCLEDIRNSPHQARGAGELLWVLFEGDPTLALAYLSGFPDFVPAPLRPFAFISLAFLLGGDVPQAVEAVQAGLDQPGGPIGLATLAKTFAFGPLGVMAEGLRESVLRAIVCSENAEVFQHGFSVAHRMAQQDPNLAREVLSHARFDIHPQESDNFLMALCGDPIGPVASLTRDQIRRILAGLLPMKDLDNHWAQDFLGQVLKHDTDQALSFIRQRLEQSTQYGWDYRPLPYGPLLQTSLSLLDLPGGVARLKEFLQWCQPFRTHEKARFHLPQVIQALATAPNASIVEALSELVERGSPEDLDLASMIVGAAEGDLVFDHPDTVSRLLLAAQKASLEIHEDMMHGLVHSAVAGGRQGKPGQPFPRDLDLKRRAEERLGLLAHDDPGVPVYQEILDHAQAAIRRQEEDGRRMLEQEGEA